MLFCWGSTIYNPQGIMVPPSLQAHEQMHSARQAELGSIERWWRRYIDDDQFRLDEEVLAHKVELASLIFLGGNNRNNRRRFVAQTAIRLCAGLYKYPSGLIDTRRARELLLEEKSVCVAPSSSIAAAR